MVLCSGQWSRCVLVLALTAFVCDPARGQTSPEPLSIISQYVPVISKHLAKYPRHPDRGKPGARQGVVWVSFCLDREGRVLDVRIDRSSGSDVLDREALASLRRASPAPAPPSQLVG